MFCSLGKDVIIASSDKSSIYNNFDYSKFLVLLKCEVNYEDSSLWIVFFKNKIRKFVAYNNTDGNFYQIL